MKREIRRQVIRIDSSGQFGLFRGVGERKGKGRGSQRGKGEAQRHFEDPSPRGILIGNESLGEFLSRTGETLVFQVRQMLRSLEWGGFEAKYRGGGRRPYHPAALLGLILFGIMEGKSSLRQLETMARTDVRSWWLTGGITPDHSVIGRFLNEHAQRLSEEFFESLTREVLKVTRSSTQSVAGDGTGVQAAASRYRGVKQEAAEEAAKESRHRAESDPEDEKLAQQERQGCEGQSQRTGSRDPALKRQIDRSQLQAYAAGQRRANHCGATGTGLLGDAWFWGLAQASEKDQRGSEATATGCGVFCGESDGHGLRGRSGGSALPGGREPGSEWGKEIEQGLC